MHHRYIKFFNQSLFYVKTFWRGNVLQINPAEVRRDRLHYAHYLFGILCIKYQWPRINIRFLFKYECLPLHHRQSAVWTDIAEAEHGRAVRDNGDAVLLYGHLSRVLRMLGEMKCGSTNARRI